MEEGESKDAQSSPTRLYLAAIIGNLLFVSAGCVMAWTSPTFPHMRKDHIITPEQESWVGSLYSLGAAFGPVIIALGIDRIGRKGTIYVLAGCFFASWIILTSSFNFYVLCVARIIGGIGVGGAFSGVSVFVAEIADNERRGSVGSFNQMFIAVGFLIENCIGPYVSYLVLIIISWSMVLIFFASFYFLPESPYYLLASGRRLEAVDSLCWYRGKVLPNQVQTELSSIEETIEKNPNNGFFESVRSLFTKVGPRKGLLISLYLLILQQGSAFNAIIVFTQDIFDKTQMKLKPEYSAMILGMTNLVASLPSPFLVRKFGLKPVLIFSGFGMGLSMGLLGFYFYLIDAKYDVSSLDFLPIASLILSNLFFCSGMGPLPWAVVGEIFIPEIKSVAVPLCGIVSSLLGFFIIQLFSVACIAYGNAVVFCSVGLLSILGAIGSIFILPYTKGLSLNEIQCLLDSKYGLASVPWAMVAEMFTLEVKSLAMAICGCFSFLFSFGIITVFSIFIREIGPTVVFLIIFCFLMLGSTGAIFFLPATKGMSLLDIYEYLETGKKKESKDNN